jgi:CRP-like cAMP-binding protein
LPFETFGEVMILDGGDSVARFGTLSEPAEVVLLPRDVILRALRDDARFREQLSAVCARRARAFSELICAHVSKPVIARIANMLTRAAITSDGTVASPLSLSQIAAACGTVKEVVARCLARLERDGAILRNHGKIVVLDRSKLVDTR